MIISVSWYSWFPKTSTSAVYIIEYPNKERHMTSLTKWPPSSGRPGMPFLTSTKNKKPNPHVAMVKLPLPGDFRISGSFCPHPHLPSHWSHCTPGCHDVVGLHPPLFGSSSVVRWGSPPVSSALPGLNLPAVLHGLWLPPEQWSGWCDVAAHSFTQARSCRHLFPSSSW